MPLILFCRNLFPENIVQACLQQQQSKFVNITKKRSFIKRLTNISQSDEIDYMLQTTPAYNDTNGTSLKPLGNMTFEVVKPKYVDSANVLGKRFPFTMSLFPHLKHIFLFCSL